MVDFVALDVGCVYGDEASIGVWATVVGVVSVYHILCSERSSISIFASRGQM